MSRLPKFQEELVEKISRLVGDWESGTSISAKLRQMNLFDNQEGMTKWRRLNNCFLQTQSKYGDCREILKFLQKVMSPVNYIGDITTFRTRQSLLNELLVFAGVRCDNEAKFYAVEPALSVEESLAKVNSLRRKLTERNVHENVLAYCTRELVVNDVFHAVLEACKGLFQTIRDRSGCTEDGAALIDKVFCGSTPILAINTLRTETERSEQKGFASLLKGCISACRNPVAHEPRILWGGSEEDAIDSLMLVSLLHKKLDKCTRVLQ
jgi:uncharacterized protein (TIGR02391 family)